MESITAVLRSVFSIALENTSNDQELNQLVAASETAGIRKEEDLQYLSVDDLAGILPPIQIRKLLQRLHDKYGECCFVQQFAMLFLKSYSYCSEPLHFITVMKPYRFYEILAVSTHPPAGRNIEFSRPLRASVRSFISIHQVAAATALLLLLMLLCAWFMVIRNSCCSTYVITFTATDTQLQTEDGYLQLVENNVVMDISCGQMYTVSQKNCANLFFVRTLSNFDRFWKFLA